MPVDESASALIPYRGRKGSFPYVSLADVLRDRVAPERLKGKIVLVGTTAPALQDLRATPVAASFPGVEIHANLIVGILDNEIKRRPWYTAGAEVVLLIFGGAVLAVLIPRLSALWASVATALGVGLIVLFNIATWNAGLGAAARLGAPRRGGDLHHEHGLRLLRRVALQAAARRALRRVRAARAGRSDGAKPRQVRHGAEKCAS